VTGSIGVWVAAHGLLLALVVFRVVFGKMTGS